MAGFVRIDPRRVRVSGFVAFSRQHSAISKSKGKSKKLTADGSGKRSPKPMPRDAHASQNSLLDGEPHARAGLLDAVKTLEEVGEAAFRRRGLFVAGIRQWSSSEPVALDDGEVRFFEEVEESFGGFLGRRGIEAEVHHSGRGRGGQTRR